MMKTAPIHIDHTIKRSFLQAVINCDYGIGESLQSYCSEQRIDLEIASNKIIDQVINSIFNGEITLYNIEDSKGDYLLPPIYTRIFDNDEKSGFYALEKYGIQSIDIVNNNGKVLLEGAYTVDFQQNGYIMVQDEQQQYHVYTYNTASHELNSLYHFGYEYKAYFEFSEGYYFHNGRFLSDSFEYPNEIWFDNAGAFSEGFAPVALNGKWGFINSKFELVVDYQFGDAQNVKAGRAQVFKLKPSFQAKKGHWINNEVNQLVPLAILRGVNKLPDEMITEYHCFSEGMTYVDEELINEVGEWVEIDLSAATNGQKIEESTIASTDKQIDEAVKSDWIQKISDNVHSIYQLPDDLFMNKAYVLACIDANPASFEYFSVLYANDREVCEKIYKLDPFQYFVFSEEMQQYFEIPRQEQATIERTDDMPF